MKNLGMCLLPSLLLTTPLGGDWTGGVYGVSG